MAESRRGLCTQRQTSAAALKLEAKRLGGRMKTLKILVCLLIHFLVTGSNIKAVTCDSTAWYENFDLLQVRGVNRLETKVRPSSFPFAEVCYAGGYPKSIYVFLGDGVILGGRYDFSASMVTLHRDTLGRYAYLHLDFYPGDSIISLQFIKRSKPSVHRWKLQYKEVTNQTESIWTGPRTNQKSETYNVKKLMAHPPKLLGLIPDTLGKEYYTTVRQFVNLPARGYAVETYAYNLERDPQIPSHRHRRLLLRKACYELGEGVDCAKYAPWLLQDVRIDSVRCDE